MIQITKDEASKVEAPQSFIDDRIEENESVLEIIKNQFVIFLFTRYEFIMQDTIKCLLCDKPQRILTVIDKHHDYVNFIDFSLAGFINCESKEEYIIRISEKLSKKMLSGKPSKAIKRLKELLNFENINTTILDELMDKRNCIAHENHIYTIELEELEAYYNAIENLLKVLSLGLKNINISIIDQGGLLDII